MIAPLNGTCLQRVTFHPKALKLPTATISDFLRCFNFVNYDSTDSSERLNLSFFLPRHSELGFLAKNYLTLVIYESSREAIFISLTAT